MEYTITQSAQHKTKQVSLPASTLVLAPQQQMITIQGGAFSVERSHEDNGINAVYLEINLLESEYKKLRQTDLFGLKQTNAFPTHTPIQLSLQLRPEALMRISGRLRNVDDIEAILQTHGPEDFPFFLQLAHYQLKRLAQVEQTYELQPQVS